MGAQVGSARPSRLDNLRSGGLGRSAGDFRSRQLGKSADDLRFVRLDRLDRSTNRMR